ncbi:MAG: hypothetical protein CL885_04865 [Dehalococcoidia bacterium]|nr:hypothetical protein [Dehalococcoidia bacterium]
MSIGIPRIKDANTETLSGAKVLTAADAYHQNLDCGGSAREVDLPSGTGTQGGEVMITNASDAAEAITVKQSDSSTTVIVIDQNESAQLVCNGVSAAAGWQAVGITES